MLGDIVCKGIIIQAGVFFEGNCQMSQKTKEKP
jgi:cytoskeletal protein CcmA (bactofilin family)